MTGGRYEDGVRDGNRTAERHLADHVGTGGWELTFRDEANVARLYASRGEAAYRYGVARAYRERVRTHARGRDLSVTATEGGSK